MEELMFNSDFFISFAFMALLFLRQIAILKRPNKINYAPLMIGIGAIASLIHFIIHPENKDLLLLTRESVFPFLVALFLYILITILHQNQLSQNDKSHEKFEKTIADEIVQLKEFLLDIEAKIDASQEAKENSQEEAKAKLYKDMKILDSIEFNQRVFLDKFDEMKEWYINSNKEFHNFTEEQLPKLDTVVNKHIEILRITEQDHHNKLSLLLQEAVGSRANMEENIEEFREKLQGMKTISDDIAHTITEHILQELSSVTKSFKVELLTLKSDTKSVGTSLKEDETRLNAIRKQSEIIIEQMALSSSKMQELKLQSGNLYDVYIMLKDIIKDVEGVKLDYLKSHSQLSLISEDLAHNKDLQMVEMSQKLESLSENFATKIDESLDKLQKHSLRAGDEITQSAQLFAKQAQLKHGYADYDGGS